GGLSEGRTLLGSLCDGCAGAVLCGGHASSDPNPSLCGEACTGTGEADALGAKAKGGPTQNQALSVAPSLIVAAIIFCASASISASVRVASFGWMRTAMATDFLPSGTP